MTGDLVVRTEEGFVKVVGRVKDFIIRGGTNIDPVEIEELLRGHPAVRDVAVVGYPDERLGERACACVLLGDSSEERRVGKECVSPCRSRWSPYHQKKKANKNSQRTIKDKK